MHGEEHNNIISVKDLHKYFGDVHILKGINFNVHKGQLISIIGRSGCGKTTLLRCLNCLEIFDSGTIRIAGITLTRGNLRLKEKKEFMDRARALSKKVSKPFQTADKDHKLDEDFQIKAHTLRLRVGMLFQSFNLFPHLTVLENVSIAPRIVKNENTDFAIENAKTLLDKVGLLSFTDRYPHQLSGGQAQRVAIARALAMNPQVMLYDEPTSALDPELTGEVLEVMKNLHNEGMTQVVVTHAMHFARTASDLIVYMEDGQIIETAPPAEIFNSPKDERTKQYLTLVKD